MWQDLVIAFFSASFGFALVPQMIDVASGKTTMNVNTCVWTAFGLIAMGLCYLSMGMIGSFIVACVTGLIWGIMGSKSLEHSRRLPQKAR